MKLIIASILFSGALNAQIVYTDIADYTGTGLGKPNLRDTFNIDLDNNSVNDFRLVMWNPTFGTTPHYELKVTNLASTGRVGINYDNASIASMAFAKFSGDSIYSSLATWKSESQASNFQIFLAYNGGSSQMGGEFLGMGDRYLPIKFTIGTNDHYGWIRINVNATCTQYIVKDFAYNASAGQKILAGQTVGMANAILNELEIIAYERQIKVLNANNLSRSEFKLLLYNVEGKKIIDTNEFFADFKNAPSGIYLAEMHYKEAVRIKKFFVQ